MSDRSSASRVLPSLALAILATALLWWAHEQSLDIQLVAGSTFQFPRGRMLLQTGTLVAVGFTFGASAEAARRSAIRSDIGSLAAASLIPVSIVSYFYLWLFGLLPSLGGIMIFVASQVVQASSAVALGVLIAAMSAPLVRRIGS